MMDDNPIEIVTGSGNVFRDLGHPNADIELIKAHLASEILRILEEQHLTVRQAGKLAGVQYADISRVRRAELDKFSVEWLMKVLGLLEPKMEMRITFSERSASGQQFAY